MAKFDPQKFLAQVGNGKTTLTCPKKRIIFSQGDSADAVFYIQTGQVKLTVISSQGKEAIVALLEPGAFFGEGCVAGQVVCMATAAATEKSTLVRIDKRAMIRVLHDEPTFSELFPRIFYLGAFGSKRTWWITCSSPARGGWRGCCCSWPISGKKARRTRSFRRSVRTCSPR